jgi:hypothetical protein
VGAISTTTAVATVAAPVLILALSTFGIYDYVLHRIDMYRLTLASISAGLLTAAVLAAAAPASAPVSSSSRSSPISQSSGMQLSVTGSTTSPSRDPLQPPCACATTSEETVMSTESHTCPTTRFSVELPGTFDEAVTAFEVAVPQIDVDELNVVIARRRSWTDVVSYTSDRAPWGFLIYWRNPVSPVMHVAGDQSCCMSYLMGYHSIAERMFRHDPRVMNYAPLRVEITQDPNSPVLFTTEIPSHQFASFEHPVITRVGLELDDKLGALLCRLGAEPGPLLLPANKLTRPTLGAVT